MKLRRNHRLAPEPLDPRYPLRGFRVIDERQTRQRENWQSDVFDMLLAASVIDEEVTSVPCNCGDVDLPFGATGMSDGYLGSRVLDDESESSRNFRKDIARIDREYRQTGSFFALKPGEKGKHGTIGGEAK